MKNPDNDLPIQVNVILAAVVILCCLIFCSCERPESPIKIGLSVNLSGTGGAAGEHVRNGALLAVSEINASGGIGGRPLELLVRDDQGTAGGAVKADRAHIKAGVPVIVGHNRSATTLAAYQEVISRNILLITACTATTRLTGKKDLFFRTCVDCNLYGKKTAKFLHGKNARTVAFLMDMVNPGFVTDFVNATKRYYDGRIFPVKFRSNANEDWDAIIRELIAHDPDAVVLLAEATMTAVALQKLEAAGYKGIRVATIWAQTPELIKLASSAGEGISIISYVRPDIDSPNYRAFQKRMIEKFHEPANARSTACYELIMILAEAMKKARELTGPAIARVLLSETYQGFMGKVAFDEYGDVIRPVYEVTIRNGRFVLRREI